jgi:hypothetical protein
MTSARQGIVSLQQPLLESYGTTTRNGAKMPTLANLRQRFAFPATSSPQAVAAQQEECLIADSRCRISPTQAVERKLMMMLGRGRPTLACEPRAMPEAN